MSSKIGRKDFIKQCAGGIGKLAFGSFILSTINSCDNDDENPNLIVQLNRPENIALKTLGGTLALDINKIDPDFGILLYRESATIIKAYSRRCTHANCVIDQFISDQSICGCHLSTFNLDGNPTGGPATEPLDQYQTSLDGDVLTIKANSLFRAT